VLSAAQVAAYLRDGFVVSRAALSATEVTELRRELATVAKGHEYPSEHLLPMPAGTTDAEAEAGVYSIIHPHLISPTVVRYARHPRLAGALAQIVGAHLPQWDGSVKCMQTQLFAKPPGYQGQGWHQDELYIQTRDRSLTAAWVALDPATEETGCLRVIPQSQRSGYLYPQTPHGQPEEYDEGPASRGFDAAGMVAVPLAPGDVVYFNGYLLHSSRRNRSAVASRRALVVHAMNAWSLLPWTNPDTPTVGDADRRAVFTLAGADPYNWKGVAEHHRSPYLRRTAANAAEVARRGAAQPNPHGIEASGAARPR
jgi:ectoine hydroxylase-related dioxygenase (phytanoyl-CoA dioxygenase family)